MNLWIKYLKRNKLTTIAILFSMIFSIAIFVCIFTIRNTDDNLDRLTARYSSEPYDLTFSSLTLNQSEGLAFMPSIEHLGFSGVNGVTAIGEKQQVTIVSANEDYTLRQSILKDGRMPYKENELVVEKWVLKNFGIEAKTGKKIKLKIRDDVKDYNGTGSYTEKEYKIVGILSDNPYDKTIGFMKLYTILNIDTNPKHFSAYVKFFNGTDGKKELKKIIKECGLKKEQVSYSEDTFELLDTSFIFMKQDIYILFALWLICGIVIYGVYRICIMSRRKEYGLLQAIGLKNKKLFSLMLKELVVQYLLSILIGTILGLLFAYVINLISKSAETTFIFWGKKIEFSLEIPWSSIVLAYLLMAFSIFFIAIFSFSKIKKETILYKLKENLSQGFAGNHKLSISQNKSSKIYFVLALKNMAKDLKSTLLIVLSIGLASALVLSLKYEAVLSKTINKEKCKLENLDGNFILQEYNDLTTVTGIDKKTVEELEQLPEVSSIETSMVMPSRLLVNKNKKVKKEYFNSLNLAFKNSFYKSISGFDEKEYIYKNSLKGFNKNALEKLKSFVIQGNYNPRKLKENEAILFMPQISKEGGNLGFIKNGLYVMDYKVGDKVTIKFRKDLDVSSNEYWELKDLKKEYIYHTFKISTIVYYPYMTETSAIGSLVPDVIVSEKQFKKMTGITAYSVVNVNTLKEQIVNEKVLENKISAIVHNDKAVSSRNITNEKNNRANMVTKESIYKFGVAFIVYVIAILNMINIIRYNGLVRKRELSIYRAIGFKEKRLMYISAIEGLLYGVLSATITFIGYFVCIRYIYEQNKQESINYGLKFQLDYSILLLIIILNLLICIVLTVIELERGKKVDIISNINRIE